MWPSAVRTIHSARSSTWVAPCSAISSTNSCVHRRDRAVVDADADRDVRALSPS